MLPSPSQNTAYGQTHHAENLGRRRRGSAGITRRVGGEHQEKRSSHLGQAPAHIRISTMRTSAHPALITLAEYEEGGQVPCGRRRVIRGIGGRIRAIFREPERNEETQGKRRRRIIGAEAGDDDSRGKLRRMPPREARITRVARPRACSHARRTASACGSVAGDCPAGRARRRCACLFSRIRHAANVASPGGRYFGLVTGGALQPP